MDSFRLKSKYLLALWLILSYINSISSQNECPDWDPTFMSCSPTFTFSYATCTCVKVTPKPTTPKSTTPKPTTPKSTTPKSTTPKSTTPKPTTTPDLRNSLNPRITALIGNLIALQGTADSTVVQDQTCKDSIISNLASNITSAEQLQTSLFNNPYNQGLATLTTLEGNLAAITTDWTECQTRTTTTTADPRISLAPRISALLNSLTLLQDTVTSTTVQDVTCKDIILSSIETDILNVQVLQSNLYNLPYNQNSNTLIDLENNLNAVSSSWTECQARTTTTTEDPRNSLVPEIEQLLEFLTEFYNLTNSSIIENQACKNIILTTLQANITSVKQLKDDLYSMSYSEASNIFKSSQDNISVLRNQWFGCMGFAAPSFELSDPSLDPSADQYDREFLRLQVGTLISQIEGFRYAVLPADKYCEETVLSRLGILLNPLNEYFKSIYMETDSISNIEAMLAGYKNEFDYFQFEWTKCFITIPGSSSYSESSSSSPYSPSESLSSSSYSPSEYSSSSSYSPSEYSSSSSYSPSEYSSSSSYSSSEYSSSSSYSPSEYSSSNSPSSESYSSSPSSESSSTAPSSESSSDAPSSESSSATPSSEAPSSEVSSTEPPSSEVSSSGIDFITSETSQKTSWWSLEVTAPTTSDLLVCRPPKISSCYPNGPCLWWNPQRMYCPEHYNFNTDYCSCLPDFNFFSFPTCDRACDCYEYLNLTTCECMCMPVNCTEVGKIWDQELCDCVALPTTTEKPVCSIPSCRPCDLLEIVDCTCERKEVICPPKYEPIGDGCNCIKSNETSPLCPGLICMNGPSINEARCTCLLKSCNETCPGGYVMDLDTCECACGQKEWQCPPETPFLDDFNCQCIRPICDPISPCPEDTSWNLDMCRCECIDPPVCPTSNFIVDLPTCQCVCVNETCPPGHILDELACICVPDPDPSCPHKLTYDHDKCECVCAPESRTCEYGLQWDEKECDCICIKNEVCLDLFIWDQDKCQCVCNATLISTQCQPNQTFDHVKCQCIGNPIPSCQPGFVYNSTLCDCVCAETKICNGGNVFDPDFCDCVCPEVTECDAGIEFNFDLCQCVSLSISSSFLSSFSSSSSSSSSLSSDLSSIFSSSAYCPQGFEYSEEAFRCVCTVRDDCIGGQIFDAEICSCVCPEPGKCEIDEHLTLGCDCEKSST